MSLLTRALLFLLVSQSLVTGCLAADPFYQVPGIFENRTVSNPSKVCQDGVFSVTGDGDILVEDCGMSLLPHFLEYTDLALSCRHWESAVPLRHISHRKNCSLNITFQMTVAYLRFTTEAILKYWQDTYFTIDLYEWTNTTNSQPFLRLAAQGTCEIAIKRLGGNDQSSDDLLIVSLSYPLFPNHGKATGLA